MRVVGTKAFGVRLPIISQGDNLAAIVADSVEKACASEGMTLEPGDVIGVTESIVAKSQGNFADVAHIAKDIGAKFGDDAVGLVFPILSRNRFYNILKGIARGSKKVYVLLQFPGDEVGNPIMDAAILDDIEAQLMKKPLKGSDFNRITGNYTHPFTGINYIDLYAQAGDNVEVYVSDDPRDILKLTKSVLVGEIHTRERTKNRLIKAGAEKVYTLSDILSQPVDGSGYNPAYGVLGSNLATDESIKLFPREPQTFVDDVQAKLEARLGAAPEVLVYGDGAFRDPTCGIWELADPVVSPAYTPRLGGRPTEIKLKYVSDNVFGNLSGEEKQKAVTDMIRQKDGDGAAFAEGTTPRKFSDLLGSLCDLMSGSGDKGTPVILIRGYFDDYSAQ